MAGSNDVGVRAAQLSLKIQKLEEIRNRIQKRGWNDAHFSLSTGPCAKAVLRFDKEFTSESCEILSKMILATMEYLTDAKNTLAPL